MKKTALITACGVATMITGAALAGPEIEANPSGISFGAVPSTFQNPQGAHILHDNGPTNGINGYSFADASIFGSRRSLLDDFSVPAGGWDIGYVSTQVIWNSGATGLGTDFEVNFYKDDGNCGPDTVPVATATGRTYTETADGGFYFGRNSALAEVTFDCISLPEGNYWVDLLPIGPENGFIMTSDIQNCACWVDYADFGGRGPGNGVFGVDSDVVWAIGDCGGDCLTLTVNALVSGGTGTWDVSGATPGAEVAVVYGHSAGSTLINGYAGYCADFGIDGVNPRRVICRKNADGAGNVSCRKSLPNGISGVQVLSQAAERNTCPDTCMSNVDDQIVG